MRKRSNGKARRSMWKAVLLVACAFLLLQGPLVLDARAYLGALPWQHTLQPPRWQGVHLEDNLMAAAAFFRRFPGGQAAALTGGAPDWNDASGTYTRHAGELFALRSTVEQANFYRNSVGHNIFHSPAPITQLLCRQGKPPSPCWCRATRSKSRSRAVQLKSRPYSSASTG